MSWGGDETPKLDATLRKERLSLNTRTILTLDASVEQHSAPSPPMTLFSRNPGVQLNRGDCWLAGELS